MYCPKCFSPNLELCPRGVIHVVINKKTRNSGQFLFNIHKDSKKELIEKLETKVDEFLSWYSTFQNKGPIKSIQLSSSDFYCSNKCKVQMTDRYSAINFLFSEKTVHEIVTRIAKNYNLKVEL